MINKPSKSLINNEKIESKVLYSDRYHRSEGDAKFEAVVASTDLETFSLFCKASCRVFYT
jgi:hypothetical protein